jgi:UDP-2,4-diacetamido-2,4,6-trideoxy-beta-L-altropyranose hydrolase
LKNKAVARQFENFHVVVGNAYQFRGELESFAKSRANITVHHAVSSWEMVDIMKQCSYAICSPSTIVYEYLSVGGIVFLEQIADNQKDVIRYFTEEGMAFPLAQVGKLSEDDIRKAFEKQAAYFDGGSGERCRKLFHQYFESKKLLPRRATEQDLELCYQWTNDPEVRSQSYNQDSISLQDHTAWFHNKLKDTNSYFYILELSGQPAAQVRFQVSGNEATLGYLAGSHIRSKGLGTTILAKGIEAFISDYQKPVDIVGYVKKTNIPSQRSFERLAFKKEEATVYPDSYKYTMNYGN